MCFLEVFTVHLHSISTLMIMIFLGLNNNHLHWSWSRFSHFFHWRWLGWLWHCSLFSSNPLAFFWTGLLTGVAFLEGVAGLFLINPCFAGLFEPVVDFCGVAIIATSRPESPPQKMWHGQIKLNPKYIVDHSARIPKIWFQTRKQLAYWCIYFFPGGGFDYIAIWVFPKNRGTPQWMIYNG